MSFMVYFARMRLENPPEIDGGYLEGDKEIS